MVPRFYSPGEGYAEMAGKDASRAMSTGKFDVDAVPSLQGFSEQQVSDVMQWRSFYRQHEEYRFVGFLEGPYYAADGSLTPKLQSLEDTQAQTEKVSKTMAEARQRFKACNSKSKHGDDNTELWCDPGYHGPGTMPVYLTAYNPEAKKTESWCACVSPSARALAHSDDDAPATAPNELVFKFVDYPECKGKTQCWRPKKAGPPTTHKIT